MSEIKLTPAQALAVSSRGCSVLVAAAAGSGKTRVITQRLISYITDPSSPMSVDSFLIITYTRAAAAELRGRIMSEIAQLCAREPENRRLRRQSTLCYQAPIGTIHSFCTAILRENCHRLGLSPDFKVGDEDKCSQLKELALAKLFEAAYEDMDSRPGFRLLADDLGAGRDDTRLAQAVLELHGKMQSHPYPEKWAKQQQELYADAVSHGADRTPWGKLLMENAQDTLFYWQDVIDTATQRLFGGWGDSAVRAAYGDSLLKTAEDMRSLSRALQQSWDAAVGCFPIEFPRFRPLKGDFDEDEKQRINLLRDDCKKAMQNLGSVFASPSATLMTDMKVASQAASALLQLTLDFDRAYCGEKQRRNLLDFSDLEHQAVRLLADPETGLPTTAALELSRRYTEIMVDEYQDVNAVQELIFQSISKNGSNIFMVGDVKQSVYRFRLADPSIFMEKYKSFDNPEYALPGQPIKILLQKNFRSDRNILQVCNYVFRGIMSEKLGDIDYDDSCALYPPEDAPAGCGVFSMTVLPKPQQDGEGPRDKYAAEAQWIASSIRQLIDSGEALVENGVSRPIGYGDIAILLRSPGPLSGTFRRELSAQGIPVSCGLGGSFFLSPPIQMLMSFLKVIDNPHSDIPLAAVLSSPLFGFSPDELSDIRTEDMHCDLFTALELHSSKSEKCLDFLSLLTRLRMLSPDLGIHGLLCLIYDSLELGALCAAGQYGDSGATDLMLLSELAAKYEQDGYMGLFSFNRYLERLLERGEDPRSGSVSGGAVTIMSIHKSKGLEFPVVFLAATGKHFNTTDLTRPLLIHPQLGLGLKHTDVERGIEYPTLAYNAIRSKLREEMLSEEMRLLYVALTRAKQRLYISCIGDSAPEDSEPSAFVSPELLKTAQSPSQWLLAALSRGGELISANGDKTSFYLTPPPENEQPKNLPPALPASPPAAGEVKTPAAADSGASSAATADRLEQLLNFRYPYENQSSLPSKLTATTLPREADDGDGLPLTPEPRRVFRSPRLYGSQRQLTAPERGVATHLVMQYIDFSMVLTEAKVASEVQRLLSMGLIDQNQAPAVDTAAIASFFASPTGQRILSAEMVLREFRFSLLCPSEQFYPEAPGEEIMLQGVVDCVLEEKGVLTVVDYKTDLVTEQKLPELRLRYEPQLHAYAYALQRIFQKPVESCLLCFLRSGLSLEL